MSNENNEHPIVDFRPKVKVTAKEFAGKYRDKREIVSAPLIFLYADEYSFLVQLRDSCSPTCI